MPFKIDKGPSNQPCGCNCPCNCKFKVDVQPRVLENNQRPLNVLGPRFQKGYYETKNGFMISNPKLIDPVRAVSMDLDRPHLTSYVEVGNTPTDEIYSKDFQPIGNNGQPYGSYFDVRGGDIQYYTIDDTSLTYYQPNFIHPTMVFHNVFQNPMGVDYYEYNREGAPNYSQNWCEPREYDSFAHDSILHREELMERQMRKINGQRYAPRFANLD